MVDTTCLMPSLSPSFNQHGDADRGLAESVSFGRYMNQTLEWDKFSAFNQNRYLEEAQRLAKPGLVAQRKALFEAHFNKPVTEKLVTGFVTGSNMTTKSEARVISKDADKENYKNGPLKYKFSANPSSGLLSKAAKSRTDALLGVNHPQAYACIGPLSEEVGDSVKGDEIAVTKTSNALLVKTDGCYSDLAAGAFVDLEVSQKLDSHHDTSDIDHMVAEPNLFEKIYSINGLTSPVPLSLDKIVIQEPLDKIVLASTADSEPAFSSSNISTSIKKHAVLPPCKLRSQEGSDTGMVTRKNVVTKPLEVPMNQKSRRPVTRNLLSLTVKELDNVKYPVSSVKTRGSEVHSDQVTQATTSSKASRFNRKSSAEPDFRQQPTHLKDRMNFRQVNMASMKKSVVQKETIKRNTPAFPRTGTKSVLTSSAMSKTFLSRAHANQVLSDATIMGKHTAPSSGMPTFSRKSTIQSHANLDTNFGSKGIQMNSARVSKESSYHVRESLKKSVKTSAARQLDDKGSKRHNTRLHDPSSVVKTTKRRTTTATTTTVFTPFRFRSDERAAMRKQKLEFKSSIETEDPSQINRKVAVLSNNNKR